MPDTLSSLPFPTAAMTHADEFRRRRGWKWSTKTKQLSTVASALRRLYLFTEQSDPTDVTTDPIWATAQAASAKGSQAVRAHQPDEITSEIILEDSQLLHDFPQRPPPPLTLMWCEGARHTDIRTEALLADELNADSAVNVTPAMRHPKEARARNVYWVPTAMPIRYAAF
ncbi:hypothetical protein AGDE_14922 [Angomonas deanei]|nr:hypothetical protein AGDE_14922 [Angomonas deanei]|eukprot:EPY19992.1 hypothetical protein AGDE_14922 [Angomonas deanei]